MTEKDSLADRLNRLARKDKQEREAEAIVKMTQEQIDQFIFANGRREFERLLNMIEQKTGEVNANVYHPPDQA